MRTFFFLVAPVWLAFTSLHPPTVGIAQNLTYHTRLLERPLYETTATPLI